MDFAVLYQQLQCQKELPPCKIFVADSSKTGYVKRLVRRYQWGIETIIEEKVQSIHEAWNAGINFSKDDVVILNDDILIPEDFLKRMGVAFDEGKGCVCPDSVGFPPKGGVREGYRWQAEEPFVQTYSSVREPLDSYLPNLKGWCFGLSRRLIDTVGIFDVGFKLWYGDTDLDRRIIKQEPIWYIRELFVHHFGSTSSMKIPTDEFVRMNYNDQVFFEKKYGMPHRDIGWG